MPTLNSVPTNTFKTFLMKGTGSSTTTWSKLCDIKDYPNLGSTPESLETTTLSDYMKTYIPGLQDPGGALEFTANFDTQTYSNLLAETAGTKYAVWAGGTEDSSTHVVTPDGSLGKWSFTGTLSVFPIGKGSNEVREMTISIMPSSVIEFSTT